MTDDKEAVRRWMERVERHCLGLDEILNDVPAGLDALAAMKTRLEEMNYILTSLTRGFRRGAGVPNEAPPRPLMPQAVREISDVVDDALDFTEAMDWRREDEGATN